MMVCGEKQGGVFFPLNGYACVLRFSLFILKPLRSRCPFFCLFLFLRTRLGLVLETGDLRVHAYLLFAGCDFRLFAFSC